MSKMTAKNIIGAIGRDKVAERLNVGRNAVSAFRHVRKN